MMAFKELQCYSLLVYKATQWQADNEDKDQDFIEDFRNVKGFCSNFDAIIQE